jgi:predicted ATPase
MSLPVSERHLIPNLSPERKKEETLEALIRQLERLAHRQPVLMVFEDAHWIDPTSRELLDLIVERVRRLPVLLIVTFRPEFQPPWTGQPQVSMLSLNRLDRRDRTALITEIASGKALADEVIDQIAVRTDGVPLFVEELTKSVLESGVTPLGIPPTLHDSLIARLDRLGSARRIAQIGAAIGREFSYKLLRAVSVFLSTSCRPPSGSSSPLSWSSNEEPLRVRCTALSMRWCRTRRMAACCAMYDNNCTRRLPERSNPILPS